MKQIRLRILILTLLFSAVLAVAGLLRLQINTDVLNTLPQESDVLSDALAIFTNHPMLEQIAIDVQINRDDPNTLVACGSFIEEQLRASGLFGQVGTEQFGALIPGLAMHIAQNLPILFTTDELRKLVTPRLTREAVNKRMEELFFNLSAMGGIGQSEFIALDPLGLKDLVLARLALLAPSMSTRLYRSKLLSADGRHLLVTARPEKAGTDTRNARALATLLEDIAHQVADKFTTDQIRLKLTPVGAFRAALDNETIIRHDVNMAIIFAMAGIGLLLLFSFSRPLIGLLSLVPALAGTGVALFVYSLCNDSISIMVLGFGGAVISITVDHGIAYLLFLDRPHATSGQQAATEVRAVGLMAVLTTVGAFLILCLSGFPLFTELGLFTALGVLFSFLYVHMVFPHVFPVLPPVAGRKNRLQKLINSCAATGWPGTVTAGVLALILLFFATPGFDVSMESMNTVSRETLKADKQFTKTWGSLGNRVFLMSSGKDLHTLLENDQELTKNLNQDMHSGFLRTAFVSSMLFPDKATALDNHRAWQQFWTRQRINDLQKSLINNAMPLGFSEDAFADFLASLSASSIKVPRLEKKYFSLLGISRAHDQSQLIRFITVEPGDKYNSEAFSKKYKKFGQIYDAGYFSKQLGALLFSTFARILLIIGISISFMLLLFYLSLPLTVITLLPVVFAYICTLGTLHLMGRSLDIPSLMLSIVILGMGIDYSIFFVRAHQRFRNSNPPAMGLVRMAVFMAAASTLIGFGVLAGARHSLLHSIGITCLLGIGYSLLGTFLILPPILKEYFSPRTISSGESLNNRVLHRFKLLEAYPRMFARFKLRYDPLFADLPTFLPRPESIKNILDIGCGYGVPAAWCLEYFPSATITAFDPDPERIRIASLVIGNRGKAFTGRADEIPAKTDPADLILLLDMLHYIDDHALGALFASCAGAAQAEAILVIRYSVQPEGKPSWLWYLEQARIRLQKMNAYFRTPKQVEALLQQSGFTIAAHNVSRDNPELFWLTARLPRARVLGES